MKTLLGPQALLLCATLAAGRDTAPVSAPGLPLKKVVIYRNNGVGYFDLLANEQRVRFNEAIRAITLREPLAVD